MDLKPGELYQGLTGLISGHGGQKTGLRVLVWVLLWSWGGGTDGRKDGRTEGRKDGRLEIPPCVLQDIGPLGPLPKKEEEKREEQRKKEEEEVERRQEDLKVQMRKLEIKKEIQ